MVFILRIFLKLSVKCYKNGFWENDKLIAISWNHIIGWALLLWSFYLEPENKIKEEDY